MHVVSRLPRGGNGGGTVRADLVDRGLAAGSIVLLVGSLNFIWLIAAATK